MEEEFGKGYFLRPSFPEKKNLVSHVLINGRKHEKVSNARRVQTVQLGVDSDDVIHGNQSLKFDSDPIGFGMAKVHSRGRNTVNTPAIEQGK